MSLYESGTSDLKRGEDVRKRNEKPEAVAIFLPPVGGLFILLFIISIPFFIVAVLLLVLIFYIDDPLDFRSSGGP